MEFKFLCCIAFLCVALVGSHAALPSEDYWESVLPNTPMSKALKNLLQPSTGNHHCSLITTKFSLKWQENKGTVVNVGYGGFGVHTGRPGGRTNVSVGKGGINVRTWTRNRQLVYVRVHPGPSPFIYNYAATETQLHDHPNVALFFLEKDLRPGNRINLHFTKSTSEAKFLSRQVADSIPFSLNKFPEILNKFMVNPSSDEAGMIKKTIKECEETGINGEEKLSATSLESMVDFSTSKLGKDVEAIATIAENSEKKEYSIVVVKRMPSGKAVVACHKQEYPYAVFYCHKTGKTIAYKISLVAANGSKAEAVAVCHQDTAAWNSKHLAFQVLKVKPGGPPFCHFLPEDHIVWANKN